MARRHLLILCGANLLLALLLCAVHPHDSELSRLWSVLHINLLRDDSSGHMLAACSAVERGRSVYRDLFFDRGMKFTYPPSSLLTCGLAHTLGVSLATLINVVALLSIPLTLAIAGELFLLLMPQAKPWQTRALVVSLGILFSPLLYAVYLGQIQALLNLLFTFALWAWVRGRKGWAGTALAVACVFKPPLALFLIWAALRREWRFLAAFAGVAAAFQAWAIWRFGWRNELDYLAVLSYLNHHGEVVIGNQSINGLLERWVGNGVGVQWTRTSPYPAYNVFVYRGTVMASALLLGFGLVYPVIRRWGDRGTDFLLFALLATVASPIAWTHHYGIFFAGSLYFLAVCLRQRGHIPWWFAVCFVTLANTWTVLDRLEGTRWNPLLSYDLYAGLGLIAALAFYLRHGESAAAAP